MPWTKNDYPVSMKNLPEAVRNKAVEIANALLAERMEEGLAIATGISRAKDWAANRGLPSEPRGGKTDDVKDHGKDQYVIPDKEGWAVKEEGSKKKIHHDTKKAAEKEARQKAMDHNASLTIQRKDGRVQKRVSYNPNNKGPKQD